MKASSRSPLCIAGLLTSLVLALSAAGVSAAGKKAVKKPAAAPTQAAAPAAAPVDTAAENRAQRLRHLTTLKELEPLAQYSFSGLRYVVVQEGAGSKPAEGAIVHVDYTGYLADGTEFDSSRERDPLAFPLGAGRVIKGWEEAIADMRRGEERMIIIPPELGYGKEGAGGKIPPNATLIFNVQLVDF